jgi:acyl-CoA synthetase (AMP-forming)/AMP-acid ligase II
VGDAVHLASLVEMVESGFADRDLLGGKDASVTGSELARLVRVGGSSLAGRCTAVAYVGENNPLLPVLVFSAVWAGVPFVPVNYRLDDEHLLSLLARHPGLLVLGDVTSSQRLGRRHQVVEIDAWLASLPDELATVKPATDDNEIAIVLYTSGTTSDPKSALLRHRHLMAYLLGSVEFGSAAEGEAVLVSVPPYHVAGMMNLLSNVFAGRRLVYLPSFEPQVWLDTIRREQVTHAMVVPTMLARIVDALDGGPADTPTLRSLSYGGAKVSERVLLTALRAFPNTGFANAYGLTETASTIAVLGPDDHRAALTSDDPLVRRRLSSVGRLLPTVELDIRDESDAQVPVGEPGLIYVRGEQVAGEYASGSALDEHGWFCTHDRGFLDAEGFLFIEGRSDDTIIRGGENISPAEIEEVLVAQPQVAEACVVGVPDDEWGQRIVAAVVPRAGAAVDGEQLRNAVRRVLRGSRTPDVVVFRDALPHTDTGKLLRRVVLKELIELVAER